MEKEKEVKEVVEEVAEAVTELCEHCGQELRKAAVEQKKILNALETKIETDLDNLKELLESNASIAAHLQKRELKMDNDLTERQAKLDAESKELFQTMKRIEESVGANIDAHLQKRELKMDTDLTERQEKMDTDLTERQEKMDTDLTERQEKIDADLTERQEKIDAESEAMLKIMKRIEESVGANIDAKVAIKQLEERIRAKITVEDRRDDEALKQQAELESRAEKDKR